MMHNPRKNVESGRRQLQASCRSILMLTAGGQARPGVDVSSLKHPPGLPDDPTLHGTTMARLRYTRFSARAIFVAAQANQHDTSPNVLISLCQPWPNPRSCSHSSFVIRQVCNSGHIGMSECSDGVCGGENFTRNLINRADSH